MGTRSLLVVVVVLVAALSGCSVVLDDRLSTPTADERSSGAPDETPTRTPAATPTTASESTVSFDGDARNDEHVSALRQAGSFTTESSLVIRGEQSAQYVNGSYAIERDGPAANTANITVVLENTTRDFPTTTRYTEGDTTYERRVARTANGTNVSYRSASEPYGDSGPRPVNRTVAYSLGDIAREVIDDSAWNETGTGTIEGVDVVRYDTSGERFGAGNVSRSTEGGATLVIDENGVVRYVAYEFVTTGAGESTVYRYEASYAAVGETDVQRPSWADAA